MRVTRSHAKYRIILTEKTPRHTRQPRRFKKLSNLRTSAISFRFWRLQWTWFCFLPNDGLIGIDIDHKEDRDPKLAQNIITGLNTYTEYSPSGKGLSPVCFGKYKDIQKATT